MKESNTAKTLFYVGIVLVVISSVFVEKSKESSTVGVVFKEDTYKTPKAINDNFIRLYYCGDSVTINLNNIIDISSLRDKHIKFKVVDLKEPIIAEGTEKDLFKIIN